MDFISSSKERIEQAKADWGAGQMKRPNLDNGDPIPLLGETTIPKSATGSGLQAQASGAGEKK